MSTNACMLAGIDVKIAPERKERENNVEEAGKKDFLSLVEINSCLGFFSTILLPC